MAEKRRGPGRPAYDSKQKLVTAASALLAERGYEATSPKMILDRAGIGQGSMYHHYGGKEALALDAISHMCDRSLAFLEGRTQHDPPADTANAGTSPDLQIEAGAALSVVEAALAGLFERREGQALIRLLADPTVGAIKPLAIATQAWCDDLRAAILAGLDATTLAMPRLPKRPPASWPPNSTPSPPTCSRRRSDAD